MKRIFYLLTLLAFSIQSKAQLTEIVELPKPVVPNPKNIKIPDSILNLVNLNCKDDDEVQSNMHFVEPEQYNIGKSYARGKDVTFRWTKPVRHGVFGIRWNRIDKYMIEFKDLLENEGVIIDSTLDHGNNNNPPLFWTHRMPCRWSLYLLTVTAWERKLNGQYYTNPVCKISTVVTTDLLLLPPVPQVHVVCKQGMYRLQIPNPQDADALYRIEDPSIDPETNQTAIEILTKDSTGDFYYDVPVTESEGFWLYFKKGSCFYLQDTRVDTVYIDIYSKPSPVALLLLDLNPYSFVADTVQLLNIKDCSINFHPLDAKLKVVDEAITEQMETFQEIESDMIAGAYPRVSYEWEAEKDYPGDPNSHITPYSYQVINDEGATTITGKKVCYTDLPSENGSCRGYSMKLKASVYLVVKDANGKTIISQTYRCEKDSVLVKTVCKLMTAPPPKIITRCDTLSFVEIPDNGYYSARFVNTKGDDIMDNNMADFRCYNTGNDGFSYEDFIAEDGQGGHRSNYTLRTHYVTSKGRISPPGLLQIIMLPKPDDVYDDFNPYVGSFTIRRPITPQNDPNFYCKEDGTFKDMSFKDNAEEYMTEVRTLLDTILPSLNDVLHVSNTSVSLVWNSDEKGCGIHHNFEIDPVTGAKVQRVCYDDIPDINGKCCMYYGKVVIKAKTELKGVDSVLLASIDIDCSPTILQAQVCKAIEPDSVYSQCANEHANVNPNDFLDGCNLNNHEIHDVCPGNDLVIGTDSLKPLYTYTYQWDNDNGFVNGSTMADRKVTINYDTLAMASGTGYEKYKQFVHGEDPFNILPDDHFTHCVLLWKCETCTGGGERIAQIKEKPKNKQFDLTADLMLYPNPVSGTLNMIYNFEKERKGTLLISNLLGQIVKTIPLTDETGMTSIDTQELSEGGYVCTLLVNGARLQSKFFSVSR